LVAVSDPVWDVWQQLAYVAALWVKITNTTDAGR
jgi:hypothetical protein